jgi:calcium-dependent protein kinase
MVDLTDTNKNGKIDYTEFLAANLDHNTYLNPGYLKNVFDFFDKDHNGFISTNELKDAFSFSMEPHVSTMFKDILDEVDENNDGHIDFSEFCKVMEIQAKH